MNSDPLDQLRAICLAFPEAIEKETWGEATFRVRAKIFAMYSVGEGRASVWCKAAAGTQELLVGGDPDRFFRPPYVGHRGWIGIRLDVAVDWEECAGILEDSYRLTAPKRLTVLLDQGEAAVNV